MLLIKSVEVITYYKAFEYRWLLLTFVFFAICLLGGLMTYISITN